MSLRCFSSVIRCFCCFLPFFPIPFPHPHTILAIVFPPVIRCFCAHLLFSAVFGGFLLFLYFVEVLPVYALRGEETQTRARERGVETENRAGVTVSVPLTR
jgi:hypothetical protein